MAIDTTQLFQEVENIINRGQGINHYQIEVRILVNGQWIDPLRVTSLSLERDYESSFGDVLVLSCDVGLGDYAYQLYPARDDLRVEVISTPLYENSEQERPAPRRARRYRAILMNQHNPGLEGKSPQTGSQEDLNKTNIETVEFQLVGDVLHQVRMMTVGKLYRNITPVDLLRSLLSETTQLLDRNNRQVVKGVDVVPGGNRTQRQHIVLDHGVKLTEVADILQGEGGGIYSTGCGCYLQGSHWRVFPLYNTTRFSNAAQTLTVVSVPPQRYYGGERTYRTHDGNVVIIVAGGNKVKDQGLSEQLNEGNAVRFTDSRQLLGGMSQPDGNRTTMDRGANLFEFEGPKLRGGYTNARWTKDRGTSSPFQHYTEMARRNGRYMQMEWLHGDSEILTPGMPVKFMTVEGEQVKILYGTLLGVHETRAPREGSITATQFPSVVQLKVFLERPPPKFNANFYRPRLSHDTYPSSRG